jgi:hypothetical protein
LGGLSSVKIYNDYQDVRPFVVCTSLETPDFLSIKRILPKQITSLHGNVNLLEHFLHHYQYLEETRKIRRKTIVILFPCVNCNEHKIDPKHCELILDSNSHVQGIALKITEAVETFYIVKNNLLSYVLHQEFYQHQPILYFNKEKFFQTYEINKEIDLNHTTYGYSYSKFVNQFWWLPTLVTKFLSLFCPVSKIKINIIYKNTYMHTTTVKYGWTMFCICCSDYHLLSDWKIRTNIIPNKISKVSCDKPNFNMYILKKQMPMSLLNLSLSSLHQNKLNFALIPSLSILPRTLCQQAPPCYIFHISPFELLKRSDNFCYGLYKSFSICDW